MPVTHDKVETLEPSRTGNAPSGAGIAKGYSVEHFTPIASLAGGVLIGLAATFLMGLNGRIAGVSGIAAGLMSLHGHATDWAWRLAFVAGIIATPPLLKIAGFVMPPVTFVAPIPVMGMAGVLVGFGTVVGGGCTSGHGVCGIARLSMRSIVATTVFMIAGFGTVFLLRHAF
ncbi:MAG: YeeE/YedE family protein [Rhodospirillaceae bacterium]|nr:MAG: YeeE/YedE family protein [Rhodospirillaceae bacterium]